MTQVNDDELKPGRGYTIRNGQVEPIRKPGQRHGGGRQKKPESEKKKNKSISLSPEAWERWSNDPEFRRSCMEYIERKARR